jgi:hypothetical protein
MTTPPQGPDRSAFRSEDDIDKVLGSAYPNPERVGCPPHDVLAALAKRERPIGDPGYEHIVSCSPCYREFRSLQQPNAVASSRSVQTRTRWLGTAAAAAVLVVAIVGSWFALRRTDDVDRAAQPTTQAAPQSARLDLRPLAVTRSDAQKAEAAPLVIPRGRVNATILLPVGSSPGEYEIRVLDGDLRVRASTRGSAEIRNYITTLETAIDVSPLDSGDYQLTLRRDGGEWQMFPLRVR